MVIGIHCSRFIDLQCHVHVGDANGCYFLETEASEPYLEVFKRIRLQHIVNDYESTQTLELDKIIPQSKSLRRTLTVHFA